MLNVSRLLPPFFPTTFQGSSFSQSRFFSNNLNWEVMELFELILSNANLDSEIASSICNSLAKALVLKLCEKANHFSQSSSLASNTYNRALQFMRRHFSLKSIEELANEVNVDPAYLSRIFRRFHKDTPYKFLVRLKMSHAASLLLTTGNLVKTSLLSSVSKTRFTSREPLKSVYGISPESFVKQRRQERQAI